METKICAKCKRELTIENFPLRKNKGKYRRWSYCFECSRKMDRERYTHICEECGKEYKSGNKDSKICSECYRKKVGKMGAINLIAWNKEPTHNPFYGVHRYGEENPNFKPDKTDEERELQRGIIGYKKWRLQVYKRDKYTCQCCGDKKGGNLNAHHLNSYDTHKEKRLDVDNGITLCDKCHKEFHSIYGFGKNTKEQYIQFINSKLIPR